MTYPLNDPNASGPHADWYAANIAAAALTVQHCAACGCRWLPARYMCAHCRSMDLTFVAADGPAEIVSWTTSHRALHPAFADVVPYTIAVVEVDPGVRISCVVRDVDASTLEVGASCLVEVDELGVPFARLGG